MPESLILNREEIPDPLICVECGKEMEEGFDYLVYELIEKTYIGEYSVTELEDDSLPYGPDIFEVMKSGEVDDVHEVRSERTNRYAFFDMEGFTIKNGEQKHEQCKPKKEAP